MHNTLRTQLDIALKMVTPQLLRWFVTSNLQVETLASENEDRSRSALSDITSDHNSVAVGEFFELVSAMRIQADKATGIHHSMSSTPQQHRASSAPSEAEISTLLDDIETAAEKVASTALSEVPSNQLWS